MDPRLVVRRDSVNKKIKKRLLGPFLLKFSKFRAKNIIFGTNKWPARPFGKKNIDR